MLLTLVLYLPAGAQSSGAGESISVWSPNQVKPEIQAELARLRNLIQKHKLSFLVDYSPALEYPLHRRCGLVEPKGWLQSAPMLEMSVYESVLPSSWDWRDLDGVTPVKNQGSCGSCWAFGTVAVLESAVKIQCGITENLSEQFLVSCNTSGWGCGGGWYAHDYHMNKLGIGQSEAGAVLESSAPYVGKATSCAAYGHPYKIASWSYVPSSTGMPSVSAIKQAIVDYGPVGSTVCVGPLLSAYRSGVFDADESSYCNGGVNHAVVLVGWKDDDPGYPSGYWIVKNSWGATWGDNGYFKIGYGKSRIGYASNFVNFLDCPGGEKLDCAQAEVLEEGVTVSGDTSGGNSVVSKYAAGGARDESGPERVYQITTTRYGDLVARLSNATSDLDVFILKACDPGSSVAFGDSSAVYSLAAPGTYYVVVDGFNGASGAYDLLVETIEKGPELFGKWNSFKVYTGSKQISGTLAVTNSGALKAGTFKISIYLSQDGRALSQLLKTITLSSLNAAQTVQLSLNYTSRVSLSKKWILVKIDPLNQVVELDESNNLVSQYIP